MKSRYKGRNGFSEESSFRRRRRAYAVYVAAATITSAKPVGLVLRNVGGIGVVRIIRDRRKCLIRATRQSRINQELALGFSTVDLFHLIAA